MSPIRRDGKNVLIFAGLLALLLAIFAITLIPEAEAKYDLRELPEDFIRAVHGLNLSVNSLHMKLDTRALAEEMGSLAKRLMKVHEEGLFKGKLGKLLNEASLSYSKVAEAARYVSELSSELREKRDELSLMFSYLENCSVEEARDLVEKLELESTLEKASSALNALNQVNETSLLSEEHRRVYNESVHKVKKIYDMLVELIKVRDLLSEEDPKVLRELCLARKLGRRPDPSLSYGSALSRLRQLDPSSGYDYAFQIYQVKSWLKGARCRGSSGRAGSGAGTWYPESDD